MTFNSKYKNHTLAQLKDALKALVNEKESYKDRETGEYSAADQRRIKEIVDEQEYLYYAIKMAEPQAAAAGGVPLEISNSVGRAEYRETPRVFIPGEKKTYGRLWGMENRALNDGGFRNMGDFMRSVWIGNDQRLHALAMTEGTPSEGGYMVPERFGEMIWADVLEKSFMLENSTVRPMEVPTEKFPAFKIGDHSANLYGGIVAYHTEEEGSLTQADPGLRMLTLNAKKLTELCIPSGELTEDVKDFDSLVTTALQNALKWFLDYYLLRGNGAGGQPLGLLNAPSLISVTKESGQSADTICYANLKKMYARNCNRLRSTWICNDNLLPELMEITIPIGTGGTHVPLLKESNGSMTIFGRPVILTEKAPTLGDAKDIVFADVSQYLAGLLRGIQVAKSIHVHFTTHKVAYRLIVRYDGLHMWDQTLTKKSSDVVSPIVALGERA